MYLDPFARDFESFLRDFVAALDAPQTVVYLDTSVLMWLVRLGTEARKEFLDWCKARTAATVRVPVWAAHEFHKHLTRGTIQKNIRATVGSTQAKYDEFVRLANERADGATATAKGYLGRGGFVSEIEASWAKLAVLSTTIDMDDASYEKAAKEVIDFVNGCVLKSDLDQVVKQVSAVGTFRADHEIPPGFHDDHKDQNKFGDALMWEEIVRDVGKTVRTKRDVIFVSRDEKTDWISAAPMIYGVRGELTKPNRDRGFDVALARPLLLHEFSVRTKKAGKKLFIANPGMLASAVHYGVTKSGGTARIQNWLSCSFRPDHARSLTVSALTAPAPTSPANASASPGASRTRTAAPQPPAAPAATAAAAGAPAGSAPPALAAISLLEVMAPQTQNELAEFNDANPLAQAELIQRWLNSSERLPVEKLGRLLAELVRASALGIQEQLMAIVQTARATMTREQHERFVLGILASAYFDSAGEAFRRPHAALASAALATAKASLAPEALGAIARFLTEKGAELPYVPASNAVPVQWLVDAAQATAKQPAMLRELRVNGRPIMADPMPANSSRRLTALLGRDPATGCTGQELRSLVASEYLIPLEQLLPDRSDRQRYTWPGDAGLVMLDTRSEGGLRPLADPVEEN